MKLWKDAVGQDVIEMFLDKIFELKGCSVYDFERYLMDVACGQVDVPRTGDICDSCREECPEDCSYLKDLEGELEDKIDETESVISNLKEERDSEKEDKEAAMEQRDVAIAKYHALKENAVLFSVDDLKDILPEYEQRMKIDVNDRDMWGMDDDEEIPF